MDARKKAYVAFALSELGALVPQDIISLVQDFVYRLDPDWLMCVSAQVGGQINAAALLSTSADLLPVISNSAVNCLLWYIDSNQVELPHSVCVALSLRHPTWVTRYAHRNALGGDIWQIVLRGSPALVRLSPHQFCEEFYLELIRNDARCVESIKDASDALWCEAVTQDPYLVSRAPRFSVEIFRAAILRAPAVIRYITYDIPAELFALAVELDGLVLKHVIRRHTSLILTAVQSNGMALMYVDPRFQNERICTAALQQTGMALKYVATQTPALCRVAVRQNGLAIQYVTLQTEELCRDAVRNQAAAIVHCRVRSQSLVRRAIPGYGPALQYLRTQSEQLCLDAVRADWQAIEWVKNPSEAVCMAALAQSGLALRFITNPTAAMCRLAVSQCPCMILEVNQSDELCRLAITRQSDILLQLPPAQILQYQRLALALDPFLIAHLAQTEELCLLAVQTPTDSQYCVLSYIVNQSDRVCLAAVQHCELALKYVQNQTLEICLAAVQRYPSALMFVQDKFLTRQVCAHSLNWII
jgi:hypothetical protein